MESRYLVVGYTAKDGVKEFSSVQGYVIGCDSVCPSHDRIRSDCLAFANKDGHSFAYLQVNFMTFMSEGDYNAYFRVNKAEESDPL